MKIQDARRVFVLHIQEEEWTHILKRARVCFEVSRITRELGYRFIDLFSKTIRGDVIHTEQIDSERRISYLLAFRGFLFGCASLAVSWCALLLGGSVAVVDILNQAAIRREILEQEKEHLELQLKATQGPQQQMRTNTVVLVRQKESIFDWLKLTYDSELRMMEDLETMYKDWMQVMTPQCNQIQAILEKSITLLNGPELQRLQELKPESSGEVSVDFGAVQPMIERFNDAHSTQVRLRGELVQFQDLLQAQINDLRSDTERFQSFITVLNQMHEKCRINVVASVEYSGSVNTRGADPMFEHN